jgi:nitrogen regulatory protein P-II 1
VNGVYAYRAFVYGQRTAGTSTYRDRQNTVTNHPPEEDVKRIEAIVRPHKVDDIREALLESGIRGMTLLEVKGIGRQKGHTEMYRGSEYQIDFLPKVKMEVVVPDELASIAITAILKSAKTGEVGDGKIFVSAVEEAIRVRTEEVGNAAL